MKKLEALAEFLNVDKSKIAMLSDVDYEYNDENYLVLDDSEADMMAEDYTRNYLDEVLDDMPFELQKYFDSEQFVSDLMEERGNLLAIYDGIENENRDYFIYRV